MKLEDIKVGQTVVDKFGNEYVVQNVRHDLMSVYLKLTKCVKRVVVQRPGLIFECVNDHFWIFKSKKVAKKNGIENGIENCITVKSLKLKESKRRILMRVLGLIGLAGSGKSTLAKQMKYKTYSFSTPIKNVCAYILGEEVEKDKKYKLNLASINFNFSGQGNLVKYKPADEGMIHTGREILQYIGTDYIVENFGKQFHKDLWVNMLISNVRCNPSDQTIVIDDVRFKHEVKIIDRLTLVVTDGIKPTGHESEKLARKMTKAFRNGTFAKKYPKVKVVYNRRVDGEMRWADYCYYPKEGELFIEETELRYDIKGNNN